jgi:hypothetical protein
MSLRTRAAAGAAAAGIVLGALAPLGAVTGGTAAAGAAPAPATDRRNGTPSGPPPSGATCVSTSGAKSCFVAYGDLVYVRDTEANGDGVAGVIEGSQPTAWYHDCYDGRGKAGGWVMCDFDVPEAVSGWLWACNLPFVGSQTRTKIWTSDPI